MIVEDQTKYIEVLKEYLDEQAKYMETVRSIKHDMQAHMIVLYYYLESERFDKAKIYLKSVIDNQKAFEYPLEDTGNDMVNAVICGALKRSRVPIEFHHSGLIPENIRIDDMDLCTIFSNLISNSIEACERLTHTQRRIFLEVGQCEQMLTIVLENPIEEAVDETMLGQGTTKEDGENHGFGIRNVQNVVKKYKGKVEFDVTEDIFRVRILFPEVVKLTIP